MMNKKSVTRLFSRVLSLILVFLMYVSIFPVPVSTKAANTSSDRVIVSLGDSFSSGEGIEDFYDQDLPVEQKINSQDWLAHRSTNAWSGMLMLNDCDKKVCYTMNLSKYDESQSNRKTHWYFVATSGAETIHISNQKQPKDYYLEENGKIYKKTTSIDKQIDVFTTIKNNKQKADYVTLTLGGNDVGFTEVISDIAISSFYVTPRYTSTIFMKKLHKLRKNTVGDLEKVYREISNNAGKQATIIVAGYPHLFDSSLNVLSSSATGILFNLPERLIVNNCVDVINSHIQSIINKLQKENIDIHYVDVTEEFDNHGAYSSKPYINQVYLSPKAQDLDCRKFKGIKPNASAYSMHPNKSGAEAYAKCVQAKIDELDKRKYTNEAHEITSPPQTTMIFTQPPPLTSPQPTKSWDSAAIDLLCNAPDYGFEINDVNIGYELIDVTGDDIPEIFFCTGIGATCIPAISGYFYYNGSRYVKGNISGDSGDFPILPVKNGGKTIYLTNHLAPEDLPEEIPGYASYWYKDVTVCQLNCSGSNANFTTVADYSEYRYQIEKLYYSGEEDKIAQAEELWESYCNEIENFHYCYPRDEFQNYVFQSFVTLDTCSAEAYKAAFTRFDIEEAVFHYLSYC